MITTHDDPERLPHCVRRIASALAAILTQNGVELSQAELLQLFRFWVEPGGGFWIRRRSDGIDLSIREFITELYAENLKKEFIAVHTAKENID